MIDVYYNGLGTWYLRDTDIYLLPEQFPEGIDKKSSLSDGLSKETGYFSLSIEDEELYWHTNNLDHVRWLYPSKRSGNAFEIKRWLVANERSDGVYELKVVESVFSEEHRSNLHFKLPLKRKEPDKSKVVKQQPVLKLAFGHEGLVFFSGDGAWVTEESEKRYEIFEKQLWNQCNSMEERLNKISSFLSGTDSKDIHTGEYTGVFLLSEVDYKTYKYTGKLPSFTKLLPCFHPDSAFLKLVSKGEVPKEKADQYFFRMDEDNQNELLPFCTENKAASTVDTLDHPSSNDLSDTTQNDSIGCSEISIKGDNKTRLDRLEKFIDWLIGRADGKKIEINRYELDCTKDELFEAIKNWEKIKYSSSDLVFKKPINWDSCKVTKKIKLWNTPNRKKICDIKSTEGGNPNRNINGIIKRPDNIFKALDLCEELKLKIS